MMEVRPLHNEQDYDWAIREIACYFEVDPVLGTTDGDRFEVLSAGLRGQALRDVVRRPGRCSPLCDRIHGQIANRSSRADWTQSCF